MLQSCCQFLKFDEILVIKTWKEQHQPVALGTLIPKVCQCAQGAKSTLMTNFVHTFCF